MAEKKWSKEELETEVKKRILARAPEFKAQASSLTFEGARRAVEQDLGMRRFSLDVHKKFIKRCLEECLSADDGEKAPEPSGSTKSKAEKSTIEEPEETQNASELKNEGSSNLDETHASDTEIKNEVNEVSEDMIKEAIKKRASFFKKHSETISLLKVRRLLEEDLNLSVKALDAQKTFISTELEKVLASMEMKKSENGVQKKSKQASQKVEKPHTSKASKRTHEESDPSDNSSKEEEHSEEVVPKRRKQVVSKVKAGTKNSASQKNSVEEKKKSVASSKSKKMAKKGSKNNSDEEREGGSSSDKNVSHSSDEEEDAQKKREKPTLQVYGKKVEHLKSIIKSCGASIPPAVYRRAKQAPEDKREAFLIKELGEILIKEGLSTNPSEKEIKEVKKRKEKAKELEGIDMSNIISSSRRRSSAFSYIPPPKPPKLELSSSSDDDDDDEDDDNDEDDDVDMEKGDVNDDDAVGDVDDGGDDGNDDDDDGDEDKGSGQDGGEDSN
ncbi:eukaryotic translation initiation factor 5B-like protein [Carex littledalei]|uniref:Eukaryotic translation initiation factor 5B-like protein n=1 Tax=Carex littledalei TaxID=544730 RepID=A0A833VID5_9POAL|nr:eukaryotic translation initiation factor 5B-like protein [Carex littledalei]